MYYWRINGSFRRDLPEGVTSLICYDGVFSLTIIALIKYNQTATECGVLFFDSPSEVTDPAILMIQGYI